MRHVVFAVVVAAAACATRPSALDAATVNTTWRAVDPDNLVLLTLAEGVVAIELFPEAAPATADSFRKAVRSGFYDGEYFYRVIEGHVAQAGREFDAELAAWPGLPLEAERRISAEGFRPHGNADLFAPEVGHRAGFAVGRDSGREWLLNCPGTVGMARDAAPDTGATEFFVPLQPRRYLDRNYTVFGRVIAGLEHIHGLARVDPFTEEETAALYSDDPELAAQMRAYRRSRLEPNVILSAAVAADLPAAERPSFEVMDTASAEWAALKESKRDYTANTAFVVDPPRVLDICTLPVPTRRATGTPNLTQK